MKHHLIMFERIVKTGMLNFIRNAWLAIAAIAVMVITLTIMLFSVIANATFTNTTTQLTDKIDVSVYLKDSVTQEQLDSLISQVKGLDNVKSVRYLSKDETFAEFKEQNKNNVDLVIAAAESGNPIPAILRIKPNDPNRLETVQTFLEKPEIKDLQSDDTSYSEERREAVDNITRATRFLQKAGLAGVFIFAIVSVLIIFNTIRMAIFNRRDELTIMRLLGASTSFIRGPFVVETVLYGVVAAIVSVAICNALFTISTSTFDANSLGLLDIRFANEYFAKNFWLILLVQLLIGIVIGAASSVIATRRYLKFKTTK